ncbi:MAG: hypothetical protein CVT79_12565 [Alphaproteobacteria bacterium HGW-Alphaproteobacteria-18]|nr:MAG: hypothetical protein CVT79_12565 [Alphaproteobacteria bacterium HGW-Alphaproteobacteria-18]
MDTNPQSPDDYALDHLLGRARLFIVELIAFIETALRRLPEHPSRQAVGYITRRALIPAETALRRAILLIAGTLDAPAPKAAPGRASCPPAPPLQKIASAGRAPVFRMSEPQPRPPKETGAAPKAAYLPETLLPRILALTDDVLFAPPAPVKPAPPPRDPLSDFSAGSMPCAAPMTIPCVKRAGGCAARQRRARSRYRSRQAKSPAPAAPSVRRRSASFGN